MEYIHLPVVNMRESSNGASKVVSQALFGERIQVLEREGEWVLIETPDGYRGWIEEAAFIKREPYSGDLEISRLCAHVYGVADTEYGPLMTLPYGTKLERKREVDSRWIEICLLDGRKGFIQKGDVAVQEFDVSQFLGLPYTWGGRSSFGFDCSGFVQMIYGKMGISLPRDARQQILKGRFVEKPQKGDLIFWGKSEGEIKHVGMSLGGEDFIHTSVRENMPYVRISKLSDFEWSGHKEAFYPFRTQRAYRFW